MAGAFMEKLYREQATTYFAIEATSGRIGISASPKGLLAVTLPLLSTPKSREPIPTEFTCLIDLFRAYFAGREVSFNGIELDLSAATPFQKKVWEATRSIPYGETRTYRWLAGRIGQPNAARAVGQALGQNPLPIIIPCHRVISSDGTIGGYRGGPEMKRKLLRREGHFSSSNSGIRGRTARLTPLRQN